MSELKRVLIVDDDQAIRHLVKVVLRRAGYDVDDASGGELALKKIAWDGYAANVLDLMMPSVSGYDVLRAISRARPNSRCVVLMSAASQGALDGVDATIVRATLRKPFHISELVAAVRSCADAV